jgi:hypothetical protein
MPMDFEEKDGSTTHLEIKATTEPAKVGQVDLFINFVRCDSTQAAVTAARPMIGADTAALSSRTAGAMRQRSPQSLAMTVFLLA